LTLGWASSYKLDDRFSSKWHRQSTVEATSFTPSDSRTQSSGGSTLAPDQIQAAVEDVLATSQFIDMHTHLCPPSFGKLALWGIDELVTYHYLEAEFFRFSAMTPEQYWSLSKQEQADAIWKALFVAHTPLSEATRGIIAVLQAFGLPTDSADLSEARSFFGTQDVEEHVLRVLKMAGVSSVVMTNDPLDPEEIPIWKNGATLQPQFQPVLRLDRILREGAEPWEPLSRQGYKVDAGVSEKSIAEIRRFLADWYERMRPVYMAVSLPDMFQFPENSVGDKILREAVLPSCREFSLPLSLMIGVRRQVNPRLRLAGDGAGRADLRSVENICREFPDNRFLVSVLSRENQHELCVYARKFNNLMPFGCWWFLNNPSIVEEITRERIELLGTSFIPQHSDARVLEQVIYKWRNTRATMAPILANSYRLLSRDGRNVTRQHIQLDVDRLFRSNFEQWVGR
jgi:hypothetical protein